MKENNLNSIEPFNDDAPELDDAFFGRADLYHGDKLIRRGRPYATTTKKPVTLRLSPEVIEAFKAGGKGWQTRINEVLLQHIKQL